MTIRVEFYGIARRVVGLETVNVEGASVSAVLQQLARLFPQFEQQCLQQGQLNKNFLASINGERFTRNGRDELRDGDALLIVSADAGG